MEPCTRNTDICRSADWLNHHGRDEALPVIWEEEEEPKASPTIHALSIIREPPNDTALPVEVSSSSNVSTCTIRTANPVRCRVRTIMSVSDITSSAQPSKQFCQHQSAFFLRPLILLVFILATTVAVGGWSQKNSRPQDIALPRDATFTSETTYIDIRHRQLQTRQPSGNTNIFQNHDGGDNSTLAQLLDANYAVISDFVLYAMVGAVHQDTQPPALVFLPPESRATVWDIVERHYLSTDSLDADLGQGADWQRHWTQFLQQVLVRPYVRQLIRNRILSVDNQLQILIAQEVDQQGEPTVVVMEVQLNFTDEAGYDAEIVDSTPMDLIDSKFNDIEEGFPGEAYLIRIADECNSHCQTMDGFFRTNPMLAYQANLVDATFIDKNLKYDYPWTVFVAPGMAWNSLPVKAYKKVMDNMIIPKLVFVDDLLAMDGETIEDKWLVTVLRDGQNNPTVYLSNVEGPPGLTNVTFLPGSNRTDILTFNGVVHYVDGLLLDKDYSADNTTTDSGVVLGADEDVADSNGTVWDIVLGMPQVVQLFEISDMGLDNLADQNESITLFLPRSIDSVPLEYLTSLSTKAWKRHLREFLLHHIITPEFSLEELVSVTKQAGGSTEIQMSSGFNVTLSFEGNLVVGDAAQVIGPWNLAASNGIVHVVDRPILPSSAIMSVSEWIDADPDLQQMAGFITTVQLGKFIDSLGAVTVFAAPNTAWEDQEIPILEIEGVLKNIVFREMWYEDELLEMSGQEIYSVNGNRWRINVENNTVILSNAFSTATLLPGRSVLASNGVVNYIDTVVVATDEYSVTPYAITPAPSQQPTSLGDATFQSFAPAPSRRPTPAPTLRYDDLPSSEPAPSRRPTPAPTLLYDDLPSSEPSLGPTFPSTYDNSTLHLPDPDAHPPGICWNRTVDQRYKQ